MTNTPIKICITVLFCFLLPVLNASGETLGITSSDGSSGGSPLRIEKRQVNQGDTLVLEILSGEVTRLNMASLHKNGQWIWFSEKKIYPVKKAGETIEVEIGRYSAFASKLRSASYSDFLIAVNGKTSFKSVASRVRIALRSPQGFAQEGPKKGNLAINDIILYAGDPELKFSLSTFSDYVNRGCRIGLLVSDSQNVDGSGILQQARQMDLAEGISENTFAVSDFPEYDVPFNFPVGFTPRGKYFQVFVQDVDGNKLEISQPFLYTPSASLATLSAQDLEEAPYYREDSGNGVVYIPRLTKPFRLTLKESTMAIFAPPHTATFRFQNLKEDEQALYLSVYDLEGDGEEPMEDNYPEEELLPFFEVTLEANSQYLFVAAPLNDRDMGEEALLRIFDP